MIGSKGGNCESPSHDRLVYLTTCLIGHQVEVQVKNGSTYSGVFHATNTDKDFGMFCCSFLLEKYVLVSLLSVKLGFSIYTFKSMKSVLKLLKIDFFVPPN